VRSRAASTAPSPDAQAASASECGNLRASSSKAVNAVKQSNAASQEEEPDYPKEEEEKVEAEEEPAKEPAPTLVHTCRQEQCKEIEADVEVPYNWQASKGSVHERLLFLLHTHTMADVHFAVGGERCLIAAHRFLLCAGSAVFDAMFNGALSEQREAVVELPDIEPCAFRALLRFLYTDEVVIGPDTVMTTLYAAKKYAVPALEQACVEFLKKNLSSENAFLLLTQACLFDEPQLAAICLETIDKSTSEAIAAEGFVDIDRDTLVAVLQRDTLGIREVKLFKAVCRWAEAECSRRRLAVSTSNQRAVLGPALHLVRFPLITVEEFAVDAAQTGLLEDRELVELFLHFTVHEPKPPVPFGQAPRCCLTGKEQAVCRFVHVEQRWGYSGTSDRIRFAVNRRIFVVGFGLYGSIHTPSEYSVNIQVRLFSSSVDSDETINSQIMKTDNASVCGSNDCVFLADGTMATSRVMFKEPIEITPNTNYTASATLKVRHCSSIKRCMYVLLLRDRTHTTDAEAFVK
jgi:BTB/POZ domain-containing protein 1/2